MADVETVCFDLDSTLCISDQSDETVHAAVFDAVGVDPIFSPADVRAVDGSALPTADSDQGYWQRHYREAAVMAGADPDPGLLDDLAAATVEVLDETAVSFRAGAREALTSVRERYDVGLVTNGGVDTQRAKLETLGIADAFDATVFCDPSAGIEPKPHPSPFERALAELDASPERTVYVGDWHAGDVVGAHAAGLQSVWVPYERPHGSIPTDPDPAPTHRLDSLSELSSVL